MSHLLRGCPTLVLPALLAACTPAAAPAPSRAPAVQAPARCANCEAEISGVLDAFHAAASVADEERYFAQLAEDAIFLGTDATERWTRAQFRAYAHPHFERGKAWRFRAVRRAIVVGERAHSAWFDEDLATENLGPARGSGVLERRRGRWLIVQYNLALTVPNERFDVVKEAATSAARVEPLASDPLAPLGWLSGHWLAELPDGGRVEESWLPPAGGSMVGCGRSVESGKTSFYELIRIEARGADVVYVAAPSGQATTEFKQTSRSDGHVVFENPKHDFPTRLSYRRTPAGLEVRVEGRQGQKSESYTLRPAVVARTPTPAAH